MKDEYSEIYKVDARDDWLNGAYDEEGNVAVCDICEGELAWNPKDRNWYCKGCGQEMDRAEYLNYIGANPPGPRCLSGCEENYPFCKKHCEHYVIDPSDPMMD